MNPTNQQSAQRALRVLKALKGATFTGLSNTDLAKATGETPSNVSRSLGVLVEEGFAVRLDNGRYAHSIALLQIAQAHADHAARLQQRMAETAQRIAAGAYS